MNFNKIEDVMYLARMNLFWWDEDNTYHDWRDAKVLKIEDNTITLDVSEVDPELRYVPEFSLEELEDLCRSLCEKHFEAIRAYSTER
jgi:hypothetical protein